MINASLLLRAISTATLAIFVAVGAADAQTTAVGPAPPHLKATSQHSLTATDLNAFLDGFVPFAIERGDVAGAVVSVVKDGQILVNRGYGYADLKTRRPVSPDETLFRPGSIGKLFTWTAVMQQVERGKLNLDRDVNDYLDFKIPPAFGKPITLRNLLTHTPGFEDTFKDSFVKDPSRLVPLGDYLKSHIPRRIFPPGEIVAYSNYGASLAGYIVQRVSGQKYADYIAENIFQPLGMSHSTMLQPLPARLAPLMSAGYKAASGPPVPFEFIEVAPAGALSSTSADMAKFMIAQLQNGRLGARQILKPATARLMHTPQHTEALGFNGFDLGFYDENRNGRRIIGHAGDTEVFHSDLHLILDANVGLFMSFNSTGANGAVVRIRTALFAAFLDRYFPYTAPSQPTVSTAVADSKRVVGWYMSSRRIESALDLINPLSEGEVTAKPDGTIAFAPLKGLAGSPKRWREVGPLVYREIGGPTHLVFVTDARGRIKYLTTDDFVPVLIFQRVPVWQQENFVLFLIGGSLVIFLVTVIVWPLGWLVRRHYHQPLDLPPVASRLRLIARLACIVSLLVAAGWLAFLTGLTIAGSVSDAWLYILYIAGVLALVGTIGAVANCAVTWAGPQRGRWWPKIAETLIALAGLAFSWILLAFGLVNFNIHY